MPFIVELGTLAVIIELRGKNGLDVFLIGRQDNPHSYGSYLTGVRMGARTVGEDAFPSIEHGMVSLVNESSGYEPNTKGYP